MTDYSQCHEQVRILEFFKDQKRGVFWDIGAGDGVINSNTRALWERGWDGYLFEASPVNYADLARTYKNSQRVVIVHAAVVPKTGICEFYDHPTIPGWSSMDPTWFSQWQKQAKVTRILGLGIEFLTQTFPFPDLFSIDTEGLDASIIEAMPLEFKPRLIVAEIDKYLSQERIEKEMARRNYKRMWDTGGNAAYERQA